MKLTCIRCPLGCDLTITNKNNELLVTGNNCIRGKEYAIEELSAPKRIVTSLIVTDMGVLPVKTTKSVPKDKVFDVLNKISEIKLKSASIGDVVIKNVCKTGSSVVVTGTYYK